MAGTGQQVGDQVSSLKDDATSLASTILGTTENVGSGLGSIARMLGNVSGKVVDVGTALLQAGSQTLQNSQNVGLQRSQDSTAASSQQFNAAPPA